MHEGRELQTKLQEGQIARQTLETTVATKYSENLELQIKMKELVDQCQDQNRAMITETTRNSHLQEELTELNGELNLWKTKVRHSDARIEKLHEEARDKEQRLTMASPGVRSFGGPSCQNCPMLQDQVGELTQEKNRLAEIKERLMKNELKYQENDAEARKLVEKR